MNPPIQQNRGDRKVDLNNLNSAFTALARGDLVRVGGGLDKRVVGGTILISPRATSSETRRRFAVWRSARAKVTVGVGSVFLNGVEHEIPETEISVTSDADFVVVLEFTVEGTWAYTLTVQTSLPNWHHQKRFRVLASVTRASGSVTTILPRWDVDVVLDDVVPRSTSDYRVPIMDYTGWGSPALAAGKGLRADIVRMTEGDPE